MPPCLSISSTRVVLPWSTWAMMAIFLSFSFFIPCSPDCTARPPGPRKAGRAHWRVQVFYEVKSWRKAGFTPAAQVKLYGVPAGRQPRGAVLPWSTWAMMAIFLSFSFFKCASPLGPGSSAEKAVRQNVAMWPNFQLAYCITIISRFQPVLSTIFPQFPKILPVKPAIAAENSFVGAAHRRRRRVDKAAKVGYNA